MKLFIWDFHGVLEKDNDLAVLDISNRALKKLGFLERLDKENLHKLYGKKWHQYFEYLLPQAKHETHIKIVNTCLEIELGNPKLVTKCIKPNQHARQVLSAISQRHHQILLSNTNPDRMTLFLEAVSLQEFFPPEKIFAVDVHSQQNFTKKDALKAHLDKNKYDNLIFIGDSSSDLELASFFGGVTYLYSHPHLPFRNCQADYRINDLREVLKEI